MRETEDGKGKREEAIYFFLTSLARWNCSFLYPHPCYPRRMKLKGGNKEKKKILRGGGERRTWTSGE